jgi:hypothetical protein
MVDSIWAKSQNPSLFGPVAIPVLIRSIFGGVKSRGRDADPRGAPFSNFLTVV